MWDLSSWNRNQTCVPSLHTMECYSALKRKGILTHATTQMNVENILLSEISQLPKDTYYRRHLVKWERQKVEWWLPGAEQRRELGVSVWEVSEFQFCKMERFRRWMVGMVVQHCEQALRYWATHSEMVKVAKFMLCVLYHNLNKKHTCQVLYLQYTKPTALARHCMCVCAQ